MVALQSRVADEEACKEAMLIDAEPAAGRRAGRPGPDGTRSTRWRGAVGLAQFALQLVCFAGVVWLAVQVLRLQAEVDRLNDERQRGSSSGGLTKPLNDSERTTVGTETKTRGRRQASSHSQQDESASYYDNSYGFGNDNGHPSLHVTGNKQRELNHGNWFTFHTSSDGDINYFAHESLTFKHGKFIEVARSGYYFVYSQMFYAHHPMREIGHEVVLLTNCGDGERFTLLRSSRSPSNMSIGDTGYVGGVFYLNVLDRVGVRNKPGWGLQEYHVNITEASYFGAFLLSPSNHALDDNTNIQCT